ncbi:hypothetical protein ONJ87_27745, partial [Salmonella enterica subsp. enterica serovar Anatum]|nr:hypothetical protein [Salmonella enterica subsp. enterica serovar Anatum]
VVATHRVPILELVERVVVLKEGQLVMDAPKAQALNADRMQSHQLVLHVADKNVHLAIGKEFNPNQSDVLIFINYNALPVIQCFE